MQQKMKGMTIMSNPVWEAICERRSVRKYTAQQLSDEQIKMLCEAALRAPSAMNRQPCKAIALKNRQMINELEQDVVDYFVRNNPDIAQHNASRGNKIFYDAAVVIFLPVQGDNMIDVGIAAESVALAAKGMGLDSVILGLPRVAFIEEKGAYWKEKLRFGEGYEYGICVAVGYGAGEGKQHEITAETIIID